MSRQNNSDAAKVSREFRNHRSPVLGTPEETVEKDQGRRVTWTEFEVRQLHAC
jgi:hypothetical protein